MYSFWLWRRPAKVGKMTWVSGKTTGDWLLYPFYIDENDTDVNKQSTPKPFAAAADQNKHDILPILSQELISGDRVLEIGSGTGQHLCFFAERLPDISWQPTELVSMLPGIEMWRAETDCPNLLPPHELDVTAQPWPEFDATVCYTANTFHIVSETAIESVFRGCSQVLSSGGRLMVYGPFQFGGKFTAPSNARFDQSLRLSDPDSGVRDIEKLNQLAAAWQFSAARIIDMPVNNFVAVWHRN